MFIRGLLSILALGLSSTAVLAQDTDAGAELFRIHCATCHGTDAAGQGPMAGVLVIKPADLTKLTAENGGKFPYEIVVRRIDGRDPLVSHGSPMPVYGFFFEGKGVALRLPNGQNIMTSQPIIDLVSYLQDLQVN